MAQVLVLGVGAPRSLTFLVGCDKACRDDPTGQPPSPTTPRRDDRSRRVSDADAVRAALLGVVAA
jgi:hypothetical protein